MVPARDTAPPPLCVKAPEIDVAIPPVNDIPPVLVMTKGPEFVVVMVLLILKFVPVRLIPPMALVSRLPEMVVIPVPAICVMEEARRP